MEDWDEVFGLGDAINTTDARISDGNIRKIKDHIINQLEQQDCSASSRWVHEVSEYQHTSGKGNYFPPFMVNQERWNELVKNLRKFTLKVSTNGRVTVDWDHAPALPREWYCIGL